MCRNEYSPEIRERLLNAGRLVMSLYSRITKQLSEVNKLIRKDFISTHDRDVQARQIFQAIFSSNVFKKLWQGT